MIPAPLRGPVQASPAFDVAEATVVELVAALESGRITAIELVCAYLNRIAYFDRSGQCLNAVPLLNPNALEEARTSDRYRRTHPRRPLEGVPFTVKDSYMVEGMTVASGSPAFAGLVATADAASVDLLRRAGAVLIGKTNMPPMAAGGAQPGLYGMSRSPYHPGYMPAAYGSGSSHGSAVAVAAGLCGFSMAEETLSSGRSPASNNALVAYTPSRGMISIRGNWPLFPTCDVVVPYTRSVDDLADLLDVLVGDDTEPNGDFWRAQQAVELPAASSVRPASFRRDRPTDLRGIRLGVPRMFVGGDRERRDPPVIRDSVLDLWHTAADRLRGLGAELVEVDLPVVSNYEADRPGARSLVDRGLVHPSWDSVEMQSLIAIAWEGFLQRNGMPGLSSLLDVDAELIFPGMPIEVYANAGSAFDYTLIADLVGEGLAEAEQLTGFADSLRGLENARQVDLEQWLDALELDALVFPASGDVAHSDLETDRAHKTAALRNGVCFSNGNRAIRHLGIPTVTVPMGVMSDIGMPVGLTVAGRAYADDHLIDIASAFEMPERPSAPWTPSIPSGRVGSTGFEPADLRIGLTACATIDESGWAVSAVVEVQGGVCVDAWLEGRRVKLRQEAAGRWNLLAHLSARRPRIAASSLLVVRARTGDRVDARFTEVDLPTGESNRMIASGRNEHD